MSTTVTSLINTRLAEAHRDGKDDHVALLKSLRDQVAPLEAQRHAELAAAITAFEFELRESTRFAESTLRSEPFLYALAFLGMIGSLATAVFALCRLLNP